MSQIAAPPATISAALISRDGVADSTEVLRQLLLFHMWQDLDHPGDTFFVGPDDATDHIDRKGSMFAGVAWKAFGRRLVVVRCEHDLPHAVLAIGTTGRLACGLDRWQEQSDEHSDNSDDDQEFDEGKACDFAGAPHANPF